MVNRKISGPNANEEAREWKAGRIGGRCLCVDAPVRMRAHMCWVEQKGLGAKIVIRLFLPITIRINDRKLAPIARFFLKFSFARQFPSATAMCT